MKKFRTLFVIFFMFASVSLFAQSSVAGLDRNPEYLTLTAQMERLAARQDSIHGAISGYREMAASEGNKEEYINAITRLESSLFDLHNDIALISTRINGIKQDYILKSLTDNTVYIADEETEKDSRAYIEDFFGNNLSEEEKRIVANGKFTDSLAIVALETVKVSYDELSDINSALRYHVFDKYIADSLYSRAARISAEHADAEEDFSFVWEAVYDTKLYAFRRILDMLNTEQYVQYELDRKEKELRREAEIAQQERFSPSLYMYGRQKEFLNGYEKIIAEKLGDGKRVQQLASVPADTLTFIRKKVELPEWKYIDYEPVKFGGQGVHNTSNPPEYMELPTNGRVFSLRIYLLSNPMKQLSSLKNAHPAFYYINDDGKYEYHLGTYKTFEEASDAVKLLKSKGFSSLVITEWNEGGKVMPDGLVVPLHVNDYNYSIELDIITPEITKQAKELAPDKSFAKINNKYVLGLFSSYTEAVKVKKKLGDDARIVNVSKK